MGAQTGCDKLDVAQCIRCLGCLQWRHFVKIEKQQRDWQESDVIEWWEMFVELGYAAGDFVLSVPPCLPAFIFSD